MSSFARALITFAVIFPFSAHAQNVLSLVTPNPLTIALSVGKWLIKDSQKVYFVQIESTAATAAQAREEGFRLAVRQAVGNLVVVETEVKNQQLVRNEIIQYSSGYIQDFKIISESQDGSMTRVVMDVWVSDSKIADRLLYVSKGNNIIDGNKASTHHQSLLNEKISGDKLLTIVLNDFPERAFDIIVHKTQWRSVGRTLEIFIPISISWNTAYINALYEVLIATRESDNSLDQKYGKRHSSVVMLKRKSNFFKIYAAYSDSHKAKMIENVLILSDPMVSLKIKDAANSVIYTQCFKLEHMRGGYYGEPTIFGHYPADRFDIPQGQFFSTSPPDATVGIYGDYKLDQTIRLVVEGQNTILENMKAVDVRIANKKECIFPK